MINIEHKQSPIGDILRDLPGRLDLGKVTHPAQQPVGDTRRTTRTFGDFQRATGLISKGSIDWRSRSPAVVSIASGMPPMKAPRMKKYGSTPNMFPLRLCGVDWSRLATTMGRATVGEIPRTTRRCAPTVPE